jgi:hypothetical protein
MYAKMAAMPTTRSKAYGSRRDMQSTSRASSLSPQAARCRRKFLHFFPKGYRDEKYVDWERGYKWIAHERWTEH